MIKGLGFWAPASGGIELPTDEFYFGFGSALFAAAATAYQPDNGGMSYDDQIALVQSCSGNYKSMYRTSFIANPDGTIESSRLARIEGITAAANAAGAIILPVVIDRIFSYYESTEQDAYDAGYSYMFSFVNNYGHLFPAKIYELSNEITLGRDLTKRLNPDGTVEQPVFLLGNGNLPEHYNSRLAPSIAFIAGMESGVKAADPTARTMFHVAGWAPTYLFREMFLAAPSIDIASWHWYSDMQERINIYPWNPYEDFRGTENPNDIIEFVHNLSGGKPVMVTESNYRWSDSPPAEREQAQLDYYQEFYGICRANPNCIGYNIHVLLDVPGLFDDSYGFFWYPSDYPNPADATPRLAAQYLLDNGPDGPLPT